MSELPKASVAVQQYLLTVPSIEADGGHEFTPFTLPAGLGRDVVCMYARGILYTHDWTQVEHTVHEVLPHGRHQLVGMFNRHGQKVEVGGE